jgi:hypothetical protein
MCKAHLQTGPFPITAVSTRIRLMHSPPIRTETVFSSLLLDKFRIDINEMNHSAGIGKFQLCPAGLIVPKEKNWLAHNRCDGLLVLLRQAIDQPWRKLLQYNPVSGFRLWVQDIHTMPASNESNPAAEQVTPKAR